MNKILILLLMAVSTVGYANEKPRMDHKGPQHMGPPPQEAIQACENQEENTACLITTPKGDTLKGQCKTTPDEKYFACVPNHRKH